MATSVSLRKSLRKIPEFRSLSGSYLDAVAKKMEIKKYKPGDVLWRVGNKVDFLAIIHSGEIVVEYQINNSKVHFAQLTAGDYLKPRDLNGINNRSSVLVRANTDLELYILPSEQLSSLQTELQFSSKNLLLKNIYSGLFGRGFRLLVVILILLINWTDTMRIITGVFYLNAYQDSTSFNNDHDFLRFLKYTVSIDSDAAFAQNQMGMIWYQSNDFQLSKAAYMRALEVDQNNVSTLNNLAVIDFFSGQNLQATSNQQNAVQLDPNHALIRYNLGIILANEKRYLAAIREFKEASYIEPNWVLPYIQRGSIYIKTQDYSLAEVEARSAIKLDPQQQSAYLILAIAQYNQADEQDALNSINSAVQIAPQEPVSLFYKALILQRLSESEASLQILQQILDLIKDPQEIARVKTEIDAIHLYQRDISSGSQ